MPGLVNFAAFLGGLGLFLTGIRSVSAHMVQFGGPWLRRTIAQHGHRRGLIAAAGLTAGALVQSGNGIAFILAGMVSAGFIPLVTAMPLLLWANLGTSMLVIIASIDLKLITLVALGISGIWLFVDRRTGSTRRQLLEAVLALAMVFLGLELLRSGSVGLRGDPVTAGAVAMLGAFPAGAFVAGFGFTLITQSSSTTTIIAVTAVTAGLITFDAAAMLVLGASAGSGASAALIGAGGHGSQRQLVLFQALTKAIGALALVPIVELEMLTGWPLLLAAAQTLAGNAGGQLAIVFVACQLAAAAGFFLCAGAIKRLLVRLAPPLASESLGMPQFIDPRAAADADMALTLAEREQTRLTAALQPTLAAPHEAVLAAFARLSGEIQRFLDGLTASKDDAALPRGLVDRLLNLRARNEVLELLHETLFQLARVREDLPPGPVCELAEPLTEGLGTVLLCLDDAARLPDGQDVAVLRQLTSERSVVVDGMRRNLIRVANQDAVYRLTSLFERAVWLANRYALLLGDGEAVPAPRAGLQPAATGVGPAGGPA